MTARVTWLGRASDRVRRELVPGLSEELRRLFPGARALGVYDCFGGYSEDQRRRIVLGVEVRGADSCRTHVVKLGARDAVEPDYAGWRRCMLAHNFSSRIFVSVKAARLPGGRGAVIYEDAYTLFGFPEDARGPEALEAVATRAVFDGAPDPASVERVIRQIYTELHRWFYRSLRADPAAAARFYRRRLRTAMGRWRAEPWRVELRRDLLWLLCGREPADAGSAREPRYADPFDYVSWALASGCAPQTLVGRSHGDLHGRNVLVGVQRGEAEYPAVFDYGEMGDGNVPVWDFVKLETEMKVRLLLGLYEDEEARSALFNLPADAPRMPGLGAGGPPGQAQGGEGRRLRAHRLAFAFRFENLLADLTERIHRVANPESPEPPGGRGVTGNARVDRALALFCRVRQEAALFLGDRQPQRGARGQWRDEYYFAAAVYGLCTAKFDYKEVEAAFALVSAGVAAARCEAARRAVREQIAAGLGTGSGRALRGAGAREAPRYPSYSVPLALAHALWTGRRCARDEVKALRVLEDAARDFGHAVPLLLEYGLALAETGRHQDALRMLEPLEDLGRAFHDEETLSRTGRLCKDLGDRALEDLPAAPDQLGSHPARAWYEAALRRYREAFEAGREYYPGINAATVALMLGRREEAEDLAASVLDICGRVDPGSAGGVEPRFWLLASQGEACVVLGREKQAAALYRQALRLVPARYRGLAQASYNQLCRLAWAAGRPALRAMEVFRNCPFRLKSGPLCNGGVRRRQWRRRKNC